MRDMVDAQTQQSNVYLDQLQKQFIRVEKEIESGKTVTINLTDNGLVLSLLVSRDQVLENEAPIPASKMGDSRSLAYNDSLVSLVTNTFAFDLAEANRQIKPADVHAQILRDSKEKTDAGNERQLPPLSDLPSSAVRYDAVEKTDAANEHRIRSASGVPNPVVMYDGVDWVLASDCTYASNDGPTITAKSGFKTDLASIPRLLWVFLASFELSMAAPVFHDLIYRSIGKVALPDGEVAPPDKVFTREEADELFLELMTRAKIGFWKRTFAYLAVKKFGKSSWQKRPNS